MENIQSSAPSGLGIDENSKSHLMETARWAKFLAIVGFIVCILVVLAGFFAGSVLQQMMGQMGENEIGNLNLQGFGAMLSVLYIGFAILYFFPCLFLYRFATRIITAFTTYEQDHLNRAFQNLKILFRYVGILTIIVLCLYAFSLFMIMLAGRMPGSGNGAF